MFALVVPFRVQEGIDRAAHVAQFVAFDWGHDAVVVLVEQSADGKKFNRGRLLNAGVRWIKVHRPECTHVWLHDVDLLPSKAVLAAYARAPRDDEVVHLASCWGRYDSGAYLGGVTGFTFAGFSACNGMPNNFEGWGGEDDELMRRVRCAQLRIVRPFPRRTAVCNYVDLENMNLDEKLSFLRQNREQKNMEKWERAAEHASTWRQNGINASPENLEVLEDGRGYVHLKL